MEQNLTQIICRIEKLEEAVFGQGITKKSKEKKASTRTRDLDFSINERAFVKKYAVGKNGQKKFTILLAYLAGGNVDKEVHISVIKKHWNKMKSLLNKFNMSYTDRAKIEEFVDSKKYGNYSLTKDWKNVL